MGTSPNNFKPLGARKQWKLLAEYAVVHNGDPKRMNAGDILHENGPSIGEFLIAHYVSRCVVPAIKSKATTKQLNLDDETADSPVPPTPELLTPLLSPDGAEVGFVTPLRSVKRTPIVVVDPPKKGRATKKTKIEEPILSIVI